MDPTANYFLHRQCTFNRETCMSYFYLGRVSKLTILVFELG